MPREIRDSFMPSTLEHRPLMRVEKEQLLRYLESDGSPQLGELPASMYATTDGLRKLEAWLWGTRFWGREVMVRATFPVLVLILPFWQQELEENGGDAVTQGVTFKQISSPPTQLVAAQNWADRPGLGTARICWSRLLELPEAWHSDEERALRKRVFFWIAQAGNAALHTVLARRDQSAQAAGACAVAGVHALESMGHSPETALQMIRTNLHEGLREWLTRYF